ncbi:hypothetical protein V8C86DRAFT_2446348 [Haematococcus lacustris]
MEPSWDAKEQGLLTPRATTGQREAQGQQDGTRGAELGAGQASKRTLWYQDPVVWYQDPVGQDPVVRCHDPVDPVMWYQDPVGQDPVVWCQDPVDPVCQNPVVRCQDPVGVQQDPVVRYQDPVVPEPCGEGQDPVSQNPVTRP